ncbi:MAG TPA: hypothetical protein VMG12_30025, partial [Polyangiaceae bacterium]|nr:hypothetical protein [Polyangiaceae bacterium]
MKQSNFPDDNVVLGDAENVSPAINWTGAPAGTQSFAIALHDLTFIQGNSPFTHWVMWNIPGNNLTGLPAELPQGVMPGVPAANTQQYSFPDTRGYTGSGACGNVDEFVPYALSTPTFTRPTRTTKTPCKMRSTLRRRARHGHPARPQRPERPELHVKAEGERASLSGSASPPHAHQNPPAACATPRTAAATARPAPLAAARHIAATRRAPRAPSSGSRQHTRA